jgi:hypothetical protein
MARTVTEIKASMTDQFMSDENVQAAYGFASGSEFDDIFSKVSIETILFSVISYAIYLHEVIWDTFQSAIQTIVDQAMVPSIYFYYAIAKEFQLGVDLVFDETTQSFIYSSIDTTKQPIAFCAVRDMSTSVRILVAKADNFSFPASLDSGTLDVFKVYMNQRKPAGVILNIMTAEADLIQITASIQINRLLLNLDGSLITSSDTYPVEDAINAYLSTIAYGGTFNKTKMIDKIQAATGVVDVTLLSVSVKTATAISYTTLTSNNYTADAGCFKSNNLRSLLSYVV